MYFTHNYCYLYFPLSFSFLNVYLHVYTHILYTYIHICSQIHITCLSKMSYTFDR